MTTLRRRTNINHDEELEEHKSDNLQDRLKNRVRKLTQGGLVAFQGAWSATRNPTIQRMWREWLTTGGYWLLLGYAVLGLIFVLSLPILPILALWGALPGLFIQSFLTVSLLVANTIFQRTPMLLGRLFLEPISSWSVINCSQNEFEAIDPTTAKDLARMFKPNVPSGDMYRTLRISFHFLKYTALLGMVSFIPLVGSPLAVIGQIWLVAERLGWQLLEVYCVNCKGMNYKQQKRWMRARKWTILGFSLVFSSLISIPFLGLFALAIAQAATAHLHSFDFFTTAIPPPQKERKTPLRPHKIWKEPEPAVSEPVPPTASSST